MDKNKVPNYTMLRLCLIETHKVRIQNSECERMPEGRVCPGYDIRLMQPIAVLKYLFGVNTQWSCQGNHRDESCDTYIMLPPGEQFPIQLVNLLAQNNFTISQVDDYDFDGQKLTANGKKRWKLSSSWYTVQGQDLYALNEKLLKLLENWSKKQIQNHLDHMQGSYYQDIVSLYQG